MKRLATIALILSLTPLPAFAGQSRSTQKPVKPPPDNLARIREAVSRPTVLKVENGQLRIYVEVIGNWPSFAEISKGYDLMNGPTGRSAVSHNELFAGSTPKEMYGSGGIQVGEMLTMAAVNYVGQWAIIKGLTALSKARSERELREIREQIDRELAAIKREK